MVSGFDLFFALFNNLAIFIALVSIYGYLQVALSSLSWYSRQALFGMAFGMFAIGCMYAKIPVFEGVIVDQRNAVIALSGVFGGPLAAYVSAAFAGAFRFYLGGQGALAGVFGVTLAATAGVILGRFNTPFGSASRAATSSLFATLFILPGFLFVKDLKTGFELMLSMSKPYGLAIYVGIFFVGLLMHRETNKIRIEKLLRSSEKRFQLMFRNHSTAMMLVDPTSKKIVDANNSALAFYGYSLAEIQNKLITEINTSPPQKVDSSLQKAMKGEEGLFDFEHKMASGEVRNVEIHASPIEIDNQTLLFSIIHDTSFRKQVLVEQKRSAQLAALGTVAAGVAHEINNPIQGIMNYATLIQKNPDKSERVAEMSARIILESERIGGITKDLLYYSKESPSAKVDSDVCELVNRALALIETKGRHQGISIETKFSEGLPRLAVQPQGLQQVVINLVSNAIDSLSEKGVTTKDKSVRVSVGLLTIGKPHHVFIEVYDQGAGMPESVRLQAKEVFFSTKPASKGAGLGLAIVSDIVEDHGGKLIIDSKEGEYTKVTAFLPVESVA